MNFVDNPNPYVEKGISSLSRETMVGKTDGPRRCANTVIQGPCRLTQESTDG